MNLPDLIARLEAAECGSWELDTEIARAIGWEPKWGLDPQPEWSRSMDAAMTLLPEEYSWETRKSGFGDPAQANLWNPRRSPPAFDPGNRWQAEHKRGCAPIAFCIACLRARQAEAADG